MFKANHVIKGTILHKNYRPVIFLEFLCKIPCKEKIGSHKITMVLYPNLYYNNMCNKGTSLYDKTGTVNLKRKATLMITMFYMKDLNKP